LLADRIARTVRYLAVLLGALLKTSQRKLLWQIFSLSLVLPQKFDDALPAMMAGLTPAGPYLLQPPTQLTESDVRRLTDAVAIFGLRWAFVYVAPSSVTIFCGQWACRSVSFLGRA
jgi:hypothetical protein